MLPEGGICMKITGAQAIIKSLEMEKADIVFGYPGAAISPFYDALLDSKIRHILTRHEQGAAHAASGYARATGKTGVCVATSGPGATNLITGIATAYMDSIPIVAITGQVSTELIGRDVFQEADITGATAPFCKHNYLVKKAEELPRIIKEAFHIASTGRPGPVLIDIPVDVQNKTIDFSYPDKVEIRGYKPREKGHLMQIKKVAEAFSASERPVICAGGGVISAKAAGNLTELAEKWGIPVTTTLMGIGSIPTGHELFYGMVGTHGSFTANYAVHNADLLIIMGARVGDRAMGAASQIARKAKIIHIDIDPAEIGKNIDVTIPLVGDIREVLRELAKYMKGPSCKAWKETLDDQKRKHPCSGQDDKYGKYVNPKHLLSILRKHAGDSAIVTTEVGQNQIWTANNLAVNEPGSFITSGGLGTMGYGLPSAVGVKLGRPDKTVIAVSGDGSFQMSMQELGTISHYDLDIKIIIFNNCRLGMVRELQKMKHGSRYSQVFLDKNPDFIKIVEAYGFKGRKITSDAEVEEAIREMLESKGTYLLECAVDPDESTL
jgi:acetolactate synthase-1/2/3 large subunit